MSPTLSAVALASTLVALGTVFASAVWRNADETSAGAGMRHCSSLETSDVQVVPHGFVIAPLDEFVPQEHARPSSRDGYWLCVADGDRHALMVPPEQF